MDLVHIETVDPLNAILQHGFLRHQCEMVIKVNMNNFYLYFNYRKTLFGNFLLQSDKINRLNLVRKLTSYYLTPNNKRNILFAFLHVLESHFNLLPIR